MAFTIGQIVELLDAQWLRTQLQIGDRGTITGLVPPRVTVLWHRIDRETFMAENCLRIYVPRVSSVNVLLALQTVLREEQPHAITELRRELAELRRELEYARLLDRRHEARHNALIADVAERNRQFRATMERLMLGSQAASDVLHSHAGESDQVYRALDAALLEMVGAHLMLSHQIVEIIED